MRQSSSDLRPYQTDAIAAAHRFFRGLPNARAGLIEMPVRSGKTRVCLHIANERGGDVLIVTPRVEIARQWIDEAQEIFPTSTTYGMYADGEAKRGNVSAGTIQSVSKYIRQILSKPVNTLIFDEAHRSLSTSGQIIIEAFLAHNPRGRIIGATATPQRSDGQSLSKYIGGIIYSISPEELRRMGVLVEYETVFITNGNPSTVYGTWRQVAANRQTIIFTKTIDEADRMAEFFRSKNVRAKSLTSLTGRNQRRETLAAYNAGRLQVLCNVGVLTEGVNVNGTSCVILTERPATPTPEIQRLGRAMGKNKLKHDSIAILNDNRGTKVAVDTSTRQWRDLGNEAYNTLNLFEKALWGIYSGMEKRVANKRK